MLRNLLCPIVLLLSATAALAAGAPVRVGLTAEFGVPGSTSAQAVEMGLKVAIAEINAAGGVLRGRPLELVTRDDRSVPSRAAANLRELAGLDGMSAVFTGKFSPVVLEIKPLAEELKIPLLATWSAADPVIDADPRGSYVFRLSLKDSWAIDRLMDYLIRERGARHVGILVPNTGWGRSSLAAARAYRHSQREHQVSAQWYNWGDRSLMTQYRTLRAEGADALLLVANEIEGSIIVREIASLPPQDRLPVGSHWGITGGNFLGLAATALQEVDLTVVQTFSLNDRLSPPQQRITASALRILDLASTSEIPSQVGFAHAYDLMHILARAIDAAGSTRREAIRDALEKVRNVRGLVRDYPAPFTATRHEALGPEQVFLARFRRDGTLERIPGRK